MNTRGRFLAWALLLGLIALLVASCASQPFTEENRVGISLVEEEMGDQYSLSAQLLTAEWTFTDETDITLSFDGGTVTYRDMVLEPGCYSGQSIVDAVLVFDQAEDVEFVSPADDPTCRDLPI